MSERCMDFSIRNLHTSILVIEALEHILWLKRTRRNNFSSRGRLNIIFAWFLNFKKIILENISTESSKISFYHTSNLTKPFHPFLERYKCHQIRISSYIYSSLTNQFYSKYVEILFTVFQSFHCDQWPTEVLHEISAIKEKC